MIDRNADSLLSHPPLDMFLKHRTLEFEQNEPTRSDINLSFEREKVLCEMKEGMALIVPNAEKAETERYKILARYVVYSGDAKSFEHLMTIKLCSKCSSNSIKSALKSVENFSIPLNND